MQGENEGGMNMEHSWILLIAMIGHILCVYADRLLLCTPGGSFNFADMKDNERMVKLFGAKPEGEPLGTLRWESGCALIPPCGRIS